MTYGCVLDTLCLSALKGNTTTLVLETLRSNETLDLRCFGVWFLALALWLDFTTNHKLANLDDTNHQYLVQ